MDANSAALRAAFGFRLARIARRWRREIDEGLKPYGLTEATWMPLLHLSHMGNQARQKDLAKSLDIEGSSLSGCSTPLKHRVLSSVSIMRRTGARRWCA